MVNQYLILRTIPNNPTVKDSYDLYLADTDSSDPLGGNKEDYENRLGNYVKFGNAAREITEQIQNGNLKSVVLNLHSETEPITERQKRRLDELVALALKGEFKWTKNYKKIHFGYVKCKH